jgi:hypothetical protein
MKDHELYREQNGYKLWHSLSCSNGFTIEYPDGSFDPNWYGWHAGAHFDNLVGNEAGTWKTYYKERSKNTNEH